MAAALLTRFFVGQDPEETPVMGKSADAILEHVPKGVTFERNQVFWYAASYAMYQTGGGSWQRWEHTLRHAVGKTQRMDGNFVGCWDAGSKGARAGGRLYATALSVLALQAHYRYTKLVR